MKHLICVLFSVLILSSFSQAQHLDILPGLTGNELLQGLRDNYKPSAVLSYDNARDTLFGVVDNVNDSLECIYSGHKVYLPPSQDPTTAAYQNGSNNGINTEHTYPQSLWSGGNSPKSDMHHLYPTRAAVNNARGSDPFADINDNFVDNWYYLNQTLTSTPTSNIDWYSEEVNGFFEPRESVKGNIARSMFYFYTMYRNEANAVNSQFFQSQLNTLCEWHNEDPADLEEAIRTWKIAAYQEAKPNPFVLDCTLADRANYCNGISTFCNIISSNDEILNKDEIDVFPNPFNNQLTIRMDASVNEVEQVNIMDLAGRVIFNMTDFVNYEISIQTEDWPKGLLIIQIQTDKGIYSKKLIRE